MHIGELTVLIGDWDTEATFPAADEPLRGSASFEWLRGERYVIHRSSFEADLPPDVIAIIGADGPDGALVQQYFDSRGVARVYAMTLADGRWTLERDDDDMTQRYVATVADDVIDGAWEVVGESGDWEHDFGLVYRRRT